MSIKNVPSKFDKHEIKCRVENGFIAIKGKEGACIAIIGGSLETIAIDLEHLLTEVRGAGFNQGLQAVRDALGIER